ncbi:MAG TPA: glycosyltransferase family 4 protein [Saprospiraceae bacterium]|nr:glycosyltransferase family 4 protein [Saprospiraceae bacterium]HMQ83890.1 glycosyltransferase family 4 protein [Saprospiraceae bacterium]
MKIGFYCDEYPPGMHGGVGAFCKDLAEGLVQKGAEVVVFGIYPARRFQENKTIQENINGVKVIRVPSKKYSNISILHRYRERQAILKLTAKVAREEGFVVFESHESTGYFPFGAPDGLKLVTRLHGGEWYFGKELNRPFSRLNGYFEKRQLTRSDRVLGCSDYVCRKTLTYMGLPMKYDVIHNCVSDLFLSEYDPSQTQEGLILFTGSVLPKKGIKELCIASNAIFDQLPHARLVIAGKNLYRKEGMPYEQFVRQFVADEHQSRITFSGALDREKELLPLIQRAAVCVFPSQAEAFALAPLEAMAAGKPVIYTKYISGPEAIQDGRDGLLIDPYFPENISNSIVRVLTDKHLAQELGKNGRQTILDRFDYRKWIEQNLAYYQKLL